MGVARKSASENWTTYRILQTAGQLATLLLVLIGGISVYTQLVTTQNIQSEQIRTTKDDLKDIHNTLQIISDKLTQVQIGLSQKADRKP